MNPPVFIKSPELDRKALEFLVKDYCIARNPGEDEKIKSMFLKDCIDKFVSDVRIKDMAVRAAWLGNDETHYVRKWADRDIEDLKTLLKLTVHWVEMEILTEDYQGMQK